MGASSPAASRRERWKTGVGLVTFLMFIIRSVAGMRTALALASAVTMVAASTFAAAGSGKRVLLVKNYQRTPAASISGLLAIKLANLAKIDPHHPLAAENANQILSMFGREDLIAGSSKDYEANHCSALFPAVNIMNEIEQRARQTSIVIVNESHERSQDRWFTAMVAVRLRTLGYNTFAMEALQNDPSTTPKSYQAPFIKQPNLPYLEDEDGSYLSEAEFGRLGRSAKVLGYRLVPYEASPDNGLPTSATDTQRIARREEEQANNLAEFVKDHPATKLLIHVGYHHALEVPRADGTRWMAARLKDKTGIDPLTINQTDCRGGGKSDRFAALPADEPPGSFDLVVDHPTARFHWGRPAWRELAGDRPIRIPVALRPSTGWRVIEARPVNEPVTSVPMDRVAIRANEDVALMLPPGSYSLRVIDVTWSKAEKSAR